MSRRRSPRRPVAGRRGRRWRRRARTYRARARSPPVPRRCRSCCRSAIATLRLPARWRDGCPEPAAWPRRCLPVSNPLASGVYGIIPTSKWAHAGITASSTDRSRRLYSFWALTNLVRPRLRATQSASAICQLSRFDDPAQRILPSLTSSVRVSSVSSIGVRRIRGVELVEVDPVGVEASQACLDRDPDPAARPAAAPLTTRRVPELGSDHRLLATALQRCAEHLLALSAAVDVGGVEEGDALLERRVHHAGRTLRVDPAAEIVATESHHRRLENASTDGTSLEVAHADRVRKARVSTAAGGW